MVPDSLDTVGAMTQTHLTERPLLAKKAATSQYTPQPLNVWGLMPRELPPFTFMMVRAMLWEPIIRLGLAMRYAPLAAAECAYLAPDGKTWLPGVQCEIPEVKSFLDQEFKFFWRTQLYKIAMKAQIWGWSGGECLFSRQADGLVHLEQILTRHASDIRALQRHGKLIGVRFRRVPQVNPGFIDLPIPESFWHSFFPEDGSEYGISILRGAYSPWCDKWLEGGALDVRRLFMHKDAYGGVDIAYPEGQTNLDDRGKTIPNRDIAREMAEQITTGGVTARPSVHGPSGEELWTITRATIPPNPTHIFQYPKECDVEILRGMEIPDDVLTSESTGAWAGKAVPQQAFYNGLDNWGNVLCDCWSSIIGKCLVYVNFGQEVPFTATLKPIALQLQPEQPAPAVVPGFNPAQDAQQQPVQMALTKYQPSLKSEIIESEHPHFVDKLQHFVNPTRETLINASRQQWRRHAEQVGEQAHAFRYGIDNHHNLHVSPAWDHTHGDIRNLVQKHFVGHDLVHFGHLHVSPEDNHITAYAKADYPTYGSKKLKLHEKHLSIISRHADEVQSNANNMLLSLDHSNSTGLAEELVGAGILEASKIVEAARESLDQRLRMKASTEPDWEKLKRRIPQHVMAHYHPELKQWRTEHGAELPEHIRTAKTQLPVNVGQALVSTNPHHHVYAAFYDTKGRAQQRMSPLHMEQASQRKYGRVRDLLPRFQQFTAKLHEHMAHPDAKIREAATVAHLVSVTGMRPGGVGTQAAHKAYGATTLEARHVHHTPEGHVKLKFVPGKSHGEQKEFMVYDPKVAQDLIYRKQSAKSPRAKLFNVGPGHVRHVVKLAGGAGYKTKDLRTAVATQHAHELIKSLPKPGNEKERKRAIKHIATSVANRIGNTPSVALKAYIDPQVWNHWDQPQQMAARRRVERYKTHVKVYGGRKQEVHVNPTSETIQGLVNKHNELRSLESPTGETHIWPSAEATHDDIAKAMGKEHHTYKFIFHDKKTNSIIHAGVPKAYHEQGL